MTTSQASRRPSGVDVAVAAGFVLLGQLVTWAQVDSPDSFQGPRELNAVLSLAGMLCLAWRRTAPVSAVGAFVTVVCLPHLVVDLDATVLGTALPMVVLTAAAGYHLPLRPSAFALGACLAGFGAVSVVTPYLRSPEAAIYNALMLTLPWVGARALWAREDRARRLGETLARERADRTATMSAAVADERGSIARELHDVVAHAVSVMVVQLGAARMQLATDPERAGRSLLDAEEAGRRALGDLRQLLGLLRSDSRLPRTGTSPQPGLRRIDDVLQQVRAAGLAVEVTVSGTVVPLPPMVDLSAYRVVQEALTNALRHGHAHHATVSLQYGAAALTVDVTDDGRPAGEPGAGHGLVGIRERAALFGGTAEAGPLPAGGWRVRVVLPLPGTARVEVAPVVGEAR